jgi:transcription antitermination factor NusG
MKPLSDAFSPEVVAELSRPYEPRDPRNAEIVEGRSPRWYVVEVYASEQTAVADELAGHRFGIYVPEVDETVIKRGRKIDRRVPMFSGYLFVFMWPSDQHWRWLADTPGVIAIVGSLTDDEIDIVRKVENRERPIFIEIPPADPEPVQRRSKKKRRWKHRKADKAKAKAAKVKPITEADLRAEIITTRAWSAFDDILTLDSDGRNQTLRKALGLEVDHVDAN